eukprot:COSAG05_NODE_57_length_23291_cov_75.862668_28_plen_50_part_00
MKFKAGNMADFVAILAHTLNLTDPDGKIHFEVHPWDKGKSIDLQFAYVL